MGCTSHKHKKKWAYALRTHYKHTQSCGRQKEKGWAPGHHTRQRTCLQAWTCRCLMFAGFQNCDTTGGEDWPNCLLFTFSTEKARHLQCLFVPKVLRNEQNAAYFDVSEQKKKCFFQRWLGDHKNENAVENSLAQGQKIRQGQSRQCMTTHDNDVCFTCVLCFCKKDAWDKQFASPSAHITGVEFAITTKTPGTVSP